MNPALPEDNNELLERIRDYLVAVDLKRCRSPQLVDHFGAPFDTIRHRLRLVGTTWRRERRAEQERRLRRWMSHPGRLDPAEGAHRCGFSDVGAFLVFFEDVTGLTITQFRYDRQVNGNHV